MTVQRVRSIKALITESLYVAQIKTMIHPAQPRCEITQYVWTNSSREHKSYSVIPEHYIDVYKASP